MWKRELTRAPMTFIGVVAVTGTLTVLFNCSDKPAGPDVGQSDVGQSDVGQSDVGQSDVGQSDVPTFDAGMSDQGGPSLGTWVTIPAGTFTMGSPTSEPCRFPDEDQHQVTLTHGFEIQSTEVTQGEFEAVMGYNPSYFGPNVSGASCGTNCPVERVNWYEAVAYCNALSANKGYATCYSCTGSGPSVSCQEAAAYTGKNVYDCPGYRLPTEAEWEYAYRAGTTAAYYSGVNDGGKCFDCSSVDVNADKIGWYCANSGNTTHPVGQKVKNAWHLYDMAGNVAEWCHDWYRSSLGTSAVTDPAGPSPGGTARVHRGGSWNFFANFTRAAYRYYRLPANRFNNLGFRCAKTK